MNILDQIIAFKRTEVAQQKKATRIHSLEKSPFFMRETLSMKQFLLEKERTGIIAEFKRRSPSKGVINDKSGVVEVTSAYTKNGASGLSVLTDNHFFGGSGKDLEAARINEVPILRKDFMIDEYQVVEAKSMGADVILLIAACLSPAEVKLLAQTAKNLRLEVLLELHDESETDHICEEVDMIGVNNRSLKTFVVDLEQSVKLSEKIGSNTIKIAESGINDRNDIIYLRKYGFNGFLIGEHFMKQNNPGASFAEFVNGLKEN